MGKHRSGKIQQRHDQNETTSPFDCLLSSHDRSIEVKARKRTIMHIPVFLQPAAASAAAATTTTTFSSTSTAVIISLIDVVHLFYYYSG